QCLMRLPGYKRRLFVISAFLGLGFAGLSARLYVLQVQDHEKYRAAAERKQVFLREPKRGDILDIHGNPLATSVPVKKLYANPRFLGAYYAEAARVVAPLLGMNEADLARALRPTVTRTNEIGLPVTNAFVNLRKKVSLEKWQEVSDAIFNLSFRLEGTNSSRGQRRFFRAMRQRGIYAEDDQQRVYPADELAAHVLGFVQDQELEFNEMHLTEITG